MFHFSRALWRLTVVSLAVALETSYAADLTVAWDDNSSAETGFEIERSGDGITFSFAGVVGANVTTYVDRDLPSNTAFWYRVRSYNATAQSAFSNVSGAITGSPAFALSASLGAPSRLTNLSARAIPAADDRSFIVGFVVGGAPKSILLRGIGPGLVPFTNAATLSDPNLSLRSGTTTLMENNDWGGTAKLKTLFSQLGAFFLIDSSKDAALVGDFAAGGYTALLTGEGTGIAMAEIFDADTAPQRNGRLMNLSVRAHAATGDGVLIVGFVIAGEAPLRVLIRAGGPALAALGVSTALADPQLEVFRGSVRWDHNDNWGGGALLKTAFEQTGAFSWTNDASKDAATVVLLPPGAYTAIVSGVGGASGVSLAEVYELP